MIRKMGKTGLAIAIATPLVASFEGLREYAYRDPVGIPTICFGETKGVKMGDHKTAAECKALLGNRLAEFSTQMDKCLKYPVEPKTYAALLSFTYNVGVGAFCKSTLLRKANAGDLRGACNELPKWNKAAGIVLPGLTKRRAAERKLCLEGID